MTEKTLALPLARAERLVEEERYEEALRILDEVPDDLPAGERGEWEHCAGVCLARMGRLLEAASRYRKSLGFFERVEDVGRQARELEHLGANLQARRQYERALKYYQKALERFQKTGDLHGQARAHRSLGNTYVDLNNRPAARKAYAEARRLFTRVDDPEGQALCIVNDTMLAYQEKGVEAAVEELRRSLEEEQCRHPMVLNNLGFLLLMRGDGEESLALFQEALEAIAGREDGDAALIYLNAGNVRALRGELEEAQRLLGKAARLFDEYPSGTAIEMLVLPRGDRDDFEPHLFIDNALKAAVAHLNLGAVLAMEGHLDEALQEVDKGLDLDREAAYPWYTAGWVRLARGEKEEAAEAFRRARGRDPAREEYRKALELVNPYLSAKVGRNEPCPCGSGRKFKKCHGR